MAVWQGLAAFGAEAEGTALLAMGGAGFGAELRTGGFTGAPGSGSLVGVEAATEADGGALRFCSDLAEGRSQKSHNPALAKAPSRMSPSATHRIEREPRTSFMIAVGSRTVGGIRSGIVKRPRGGGGSLAAITKVPLPDLTARVELEAEPGWLSEWNAEKSGWLTS